MKSLLFDKKVGHICVTNKITFTTTTKKKSTVTIAVLKPSSCCCMRKVKVYGTAANPPVFLTSLFLKSILHLIYHKSFCYQLKQILLFRNKDFPFENAFFYFLILFIQIARVQIIRVLLHQQFQ